MEAFDDDRTRLSIKRLLDSAEKKYNNITFIERDPISIPHLFTKKQDIEIAGLFASVFAWGQRTTIINKCKDLLHRMDHDPYRFVLHHQSSDLKKLVGFTHRTFNDTDLLYFISFLKFWYSKHPSLEDAFCLKHTSSQLQVEESLNGFRAIFFSMPDVPERTFKHIASPQMHSACKRLNMFLRWMVRKDKNGVDFGLWKKIKPSQLICPIDVHVHHTATTLGLITRKQTDWKTALELTQTLRIFDKNDPVKYDYALFGLSISHAL